MVDGTTLASLMLYLTGDPYTDPNCLPAGPLLFDAGDIVVPTSQACTFSMAGSSNQYTVVGDVVETFPFTSGNIIPTQEVGYGGVTLNYNPVSWSASYA